MNLLDQLELYVLGLGRGEVVQKDYWLFVYTSMRSGELATELMEKYVREKLRGLGVESP